MEAYDGKEIDEMEKKIEKIWNSKIVQPTAYDFLEMYLKVMT